MNYSKQCICILFFLGTAFASQQLIAQNNSKKQIRGQLYFGIGKAKLTKADYYQNSQDLHAEIGTILYFNKRKKKTFYTGIHWTMLSANLFNGERGIVGTQIGPELSLRLAKPIILSTGYQYRLQNAFYDLEELAIDLSSAHAFHIAFKLTVLKIKIEYIHSTASSHTPSFMNTTVGLTF